MTHRTEEDIEKQSGEKKKQMFEQNGKKMRMFCNNKSGSRGEKKDHHEIGIIKRRRHTMRHKSRVVYGYPTRG